MGMFNTVSARLKCPACNCDVTLPVQFKYADTWQYQYEIGEDLRWGGNDIGLPGKRHVVVDGVVAGKCPKCGYDDEWNVYVHIECDRIARVENATGKYQFVADSNYVVLE